MNVIDKYFGSVCDEPSGDIRVNEVFSVDGTNYVRLSTDQLFGIEKFKLKIMNMSTFDIHAFNIPKRTGVKPKHMLEYLNGKTFVPIKCKDISKVYKLESKDNLMPFGTRLINNEIEFIVSRVHVNGEYYFVLINSETGNTYASSVKSSSMNGVTRDEFDGLIGKCMFEFFTEIKE